MAEWTKFEDGLADKREVLAIARAIGLHPERVACKLMAVWAWARRNSADGVLHGVCIKDIDKPAGRPGFGKAMAAPGVMWVTDTPDGIVFPKWERHNSNGAKQRAEDARRKENGRKSGSCPKTSGHFSDKTRTRLDDDKREIRIRNQSATNASGFSPATEAEPTTDFHLATTTAVETVFGELTSADRRRLAAWTIGVEADQPVRIEGEGDVPATAIAADGIREAIAAGANDCVAGFLGFVNKCIGRSRRKGVRPGVATALKPTAAFTPSPREDFDGCLPGETTLQALVRKGKL